MENQVQANDIFLSFDVKRGNLRKFINKLRRKLRAILPRYHGLLVFDGVFRGWCVITLRTPESNLVIKINTRSFFFMGFQSQQTLWRLNYPDTDNFGGAQNFSYAGSYSELLSNSGVDQLYNIDLTPDSISHSVHVLHTFSGDLQNREVPLSMLRIILMICEPVRFYSIQKRVNHIFRRSRLNQLFRGNEPDAPESKRLTYLDRYIVTKWDTISTAFFKGQYANIPAELGIFSDVDVRKKLAIGLLTRNNKSSDGGGDDNPHDGKGRNRKRVDRTCTIGLK